MVTYRFDGVYFTSVSGCGSCGSRKTVVSLRKTNANININGEVLLYKVGSLYEFSDAEARVIEGYVQQKKYAFTKID